MDVPKGDKITVSNPASSETGKPSEGDQKGRCSPYVQLRRAWVKSPAYPEKKPEHCWCPNTTNPPEQKTQSQKIVMMLFLLISREAGVCFVLKTEQSLTMPSEKQDPPLSRPKRLQGIKKVLFS